MVAVVVVATAVAAAVEVLLIVVHVTTVAGLVLGAAVADTVVVIGTSEDSRVVPSALAPATTVTSALAVVPAVVVKADMIVESGFAILGKVAWRVGVTNEPSEIGLSTAVVLGRKLVLNVVGIVMFPATAPSLKDVLLGHGPMGLFEGVLVLMSVAWMSSDV